MNTVKGYGKVSGYKLVPAQSVVQLKAALNMQPVVIGIDASSLIFIHFESGVITSYQCGTTPNHAVLAVGYGSLNGIEFFLVKNSYGPNWGDEGYVRIGVNNVCGILGSPMYPLA